MLLAAPEPYTTGMPQADSAVSTKRNRRRHRLQVGVHYLAGGIILLKASQLREHWPYALLVGAAGIAILIAAALHQRMEHRVRFAHSTMHLAESLALATEAYLLATEGKHGVQYPAALAALFYLGAAIVTFTRERRRRPALKA